MTVLGLVDADSAFFDHETGVDWNVIFLLFGMMVIVGVMKQTGLFEYLRCGPPGPPEAARYACSGC